MWIAWAPCTCSSQTIWTIFSATSHHQRPRTMLVKLRDFISQRRRVESRAVRGRARCFIFSLFSFFYSEWYFLHSPTARGDGSSQCKHAVSKPAHPRMRVFGTRLRGGGRGRSSAFSLWWMYSVGCFCDAIDGARVFGISVLLYDRDVQSMPSHVFPCFPMPHHARP